MILELFGDDFASLLGISGINQWSFRIPFISLDSLYALTQPVHDTHTGLVCPLCDPNHHLVTGLLVLPAFRSSCHAKKVYKSIKSEYRGNKKAT